MTTYNPLSGNPVRNNGGTVFNAGNYDGVAVTAALTPQAAALVRTQYGSQVIEAGYGASGNLGTWRPRSGDAFASPPEGFLIKGLTTGQTVLGVSDSGLSAANPGHSKAINRWYGYERLHITSWNHLTGAATHGAHAGTTIVASGIDGTTGQVADHAANPTDAIPGELVYMTNGYLPTQDDYKARTNP